MLEAHLGPLVDFLWDEYAEAMAEPPTCSLCDGLGHGYPGAGPCPLEERGYWDAEEDLARYGSY